VCGANRNHTKIHLHKALVGIGMFHNVQQSFMVVDTPMMYVTGIFGLLKVLRRVNHVYSVTEYAKATVNAENLCLQETF
jgi:hypothetical protein